MEKLPVGWLPQSETEEEEDNVLLIDGMDSLDDFTTEQYAALYNEDIQDALGTISDINLEPQICYERPRKQLKASSTTDVLISGSIDQKSDAVSKQATKSDGKKKKASNPRIRPRCTPGHVIAERKRREKLSQQFIALSALVPSLIKMDKASVLGVCITYVKHLETRVKKLKERTTKTTMESAIFVKKFQVSSDTDSSSLTAKSSSDFLIEQFPKVEAIISNKNVQIRVHCEKRIGAMAQILLEIEKLNLNVVSSSALPLESSTFDLTVTAQMNGDCDMTVKDLLKKLRMAII